ncbi:hypothetical protein NT03LS_1895a, partial [Listeria seeligeri FSL N1-067]
IYARVGHSDAVLDYHDLYNEYLLLLYHLVQTVPFSMLL